MIVWLLPIGITLLGEVYARLGGEDIVADLGGVGRGYHSNSSLAKPLVIVAQQPSSSRDSMSAFVKATCCLKSVSVGWLCFEVTSSKKQYFAGRLCGIA